VAPAAWAIEFSYKIGKCYQSANGSETFRAFHARETTTCFLRSRNDLVSCRKAMSSRHETGRKGTVTATKLFHFSGLIREPATLRGRMRQPIRPFITEFKSRSSKSSAPRPPTIEGADKDGQTPPFLDPGVFASRRTNPSDEYEAAMRAADAAFGKSRSADPASGKAPTAVAPVGQVLRSLIDEDDPLTVRLKKADEKPRRGRPPGKGKTPSPAPRNKPPAQPQRKAAPSSVEQPIANRAPEQAIVSTARRERGSIQKRWVLKTELKAGEKWKRRLCKAVR